MQEATDLVGVRRVIKAELGAETLAALMKPNRLLDVLGLVATWAFFLGLVVILGTQPIGPLWAIAFILHGFALQLLALISHDLFVHRRVGGATLSWIGSVLCTIPRLTKPTAYEFVHLEHHRHIGTERDTEGYKQDIDTVARRVFFLTLPGIKMLQGRRLARPDPVTGAMPVGYHAQANARPEYLRKLAIETWLARAYLLGVLASAIVWPRFVLLGYVLPLLVMGPIANTARTILEHAEVNPNNAFHIATFYRTGPVTRLFFLWDSGDCHLIHHLYATIPYYRVGRALDLMRPILLRNGVIERTSIVELAWGWFVANRPHRSLWPVRAARA
jgi:fatty acid desaturase